MALWQRIYHAFKTEAENNIEFLKLVRTREITDYPSLSSKNVINSDLRDEDNLDDLVNLYLQNKLITTRMGSVESTFILKELFGLVFNDHIKDACDRYGKDYLLRANAGFYCKDEAEKQMVINWWIERTLSAIKKSVLTSCFCVLHYDLILWASLNLKGVFYNWGYLPKLILQNSYKKTILYIGSGVKSIQCGYDRGVQKAWTFHVPNFELQTLETPQTTLGMPYPDKSIKETTEKLIDTIINEYTNFDTAIFGCGAYGPPLIDLLSEKLTGKNLIYLGSACYTMFGIYSHEMHIPEQETIKENWVEVLEEYDERLSNIDGGKYWKRKF